jgi:hypothetical protein
MGRVDQHIVNRPLHVGAEHGAKFGVLQAPRVVRGGQGQESWLASGELE